VGSGFLLKAAVAVIAGVVATGVSGDHTRQAGATPRLAVQAVLGSGSERQLQPELAAGVRAAGRAAVSAGRIIKGPVATSRRAARPGEDGSPPSASAPVRAGDSAPPPQSSPSGAPSTP